MENEVSEKYETYAYYWVDGFDCDHTKISEILDLEPSEIRLKGQASTPVLTRRVKENSWMYHSSLPRNEPYQDAHLENLLSTLLLRKRQILSLNEKYKSGINCVGYYTNTNAGFHMSKKLINDCASLNLDIDFDLYNY